MFGYPTLLHDSRLADAPLVASGSAAGFSVQNLVDFRAYTWWQADALPATVTVNSGSANAADYWLVYGHDLNTQGATIELRGSNDNFATQDVLIDALTPANDKPILRMFNSAAYNDWRIQITGTTVPTLAIVTVGNKLEFPRRLPRGFDPIGKKTQGRVNRSVKGQPLGVIVDYVQWKQSIRFRNIDITWLRNTWAQAFDSHLSRMPFAFAWDPAEHVDELYLVHPLVAFNAPHTGGPYCDLSFELLGVA